MSTTFDSSRRYRDREDEKPFYDDGREIELLHYVWSRPDIDSLRGSPERVCRAIDDFGVDKKYLMTVGTDKGKVVTDLIAEHKPKIMVELGAYIGYSAVLFGSALKAAGGSRFYTCELNPEFAAVTTMLVDLAGLSDIVKVIVGASDQCIRRLHAQSDLRHIDLMFLDHYKPAYKTDLKICEELGLISPGTVLAADNVIVPGNPPYLEYVRSTVAEKRKSAEGGAGGRKEDAGLFGAKSNVNDYQKHINGEQTDSLGNPNIVYESQLIERWDPTGLKDGLEITRCIRIEV